jgi:hypothetical protein
MSLCKNRPFGTFIAVLVYLMAIWYFCDHSASFPFCTKKNLATLIISSLIGIPLLALTLEKFANENVKSQSPQDQFLSVPNRLFSSSDKVTRFVHWRLLSMGRFLLITEVASILAHFIHGLGYAIFFYKNMYFGRFL